MRDHRRLEAWRVSHALAIDVLKVSRSHWRPWASALFGQLQRSSLSVPLNIAEGSSFGVSPTYRRHLGVAYGSAVETEDLILIARGADVLPSAMIDDLAAKALLSRRLLIGLLKRHRPMSAATRS